MSERIIVAMTNDSDQSIRIVEDDGGYFLEVCDIKFHGRHAKWSAIELQASDACEIAAVIARRAQG